MLETGAGFFHCIFVPSHTDECSNVLSVVFSYIFCPTLKFAGKMLLILNMISNGAIPFLFGMCNRRNKMKKRGKEGNSKQIRRSQIKKERKLAVTLYHGFEGLDVNNTDYKLQYLTVP